MSSFPTRRTFVGAAAASLAGAGLPAAQQETELCVALCNHWSYIGIGWQLGLESNVLSVVDAMEMADRPPGVKTCINLDARAYELIAERYPEIAARLKRYLAAGKVELIGGTYGQPLGTMFSGESNIRQIVVGREVIRRALDYELVTFLEEEEFTHPQMPQLLAGAGFRYASLAQVDTWGAAGVPRLEVNSFRWRGKDGSEIPSTPKNSLYLAFTVDPKALAESPGFRKLATLGKPLAFTWEEFGWESPEKPSYLTAPEKYQKLADRFRAEFVTLQEYMDKYGKKGAEPVYFDMDSWRKLLTWGLGGDQLRILDRKVEGVLLSAEKFDAIASSMGASSKAGVLESAWKDLLASQSHDVSLCEYSRWQGDRMAPLERTEDFHNFTWGVIGYNHLDAAHRQAQPVLDASLRHIAARVSSGEAQRGQLAVTVFNPHSWERTGIAVTGRIYPVPQPARGITVRDRNGRAVLSQVVTSERDGSDLLVADVAFLAEGVPALGYDTYYLDFGPASAPPATGLRIDESALVLENEHVRVRLDPVTGAVSSLLDKKSGLETLRAQGGTFPVFSGSPNPTYPLRTFFGGRGKPMPAGYDSSGSKAEIDWTEKGPLRATVRARHNWPLLKFETRVTLSARLPWVEVITRVLSEVPPKPDSLNERRRFPVEIREGYWISLAPAFQVTSVLRDFPFGVEPTRHSDFHAMTFVDLLGAEGGLLVLHPGTQWFKRAGETFSNLLMREWESYFTGEFGWPRYAEYRHALVPHGGAYQNADRLRASASFTHPLLALVGKPASGPLPLRRSFLEVSPANVQLSALRRLATGELEIRLAETDGRAASAAVEFGIPLRSAVETDLLGARVAGAGIGGSRLSFQTAPWKVRTFRLG